MKKVFFTSGPRGSGKSEYVRKVSLCHPHVIVVSRDEIIMRHGGSTWMDPYSGMSEIVLEEIWGLVARAMVPDNERVHVLIDCWNWSSDDRKHLVQKAREVGADWVGCLQFFLSVERCIEWCRMKPELHGAHDASITDDHRAYYENAADIESDGFDQVISVTPEEELTTLFLYE